MSVLSEKKPFLALLLAAISVLPFAVVSGSPQEVFISCALIFLFLCLFNNKLVFLAASLIIFFASFLQLIYTLYCGKKIDEYYWIALWSTNSSETSSFIESLSISDILFYIGFFCFYAVAFVQCFRVAHGKIKIFASVILAIVILSSHFDFIRQSAGSDLKSLFPFYLVSSYANAVSSIQDVIVDEDVITRVAGPKVDDIYLFLGESASKTRMSVYGYSRDTTPNLRTQGWVVFQDYIANGLNTQPNLKALLSGHVLSATDLVSFDIIRMAKIAGYEVYYLDNNKFQSIDPIYAIASQAHYTSLNGLGETTRETDDAIKYDGHLTDPLKRIVNIRKRKLVIVHMAGSHPSQEKRYPPEFDVFDNAYDNSIGYSDSLIGNWSDYILKNSADRSVVLFMIADHGVKIPPGCGLGQLSQGDYSSYGADDRYYSSIAIPLLVKANEVFELAQPALIERLHNNVAKSLDHSAFLPSLATLMGFTEIGGYDMRRSIFEEKFQSYIRTNTEGEDIDELVRIGRVCVPDDSP